MNRAMTVLRLLCVLVLLVPLAALAEDTPDDDRTATRENGGPNSQKANPEASELDEYVEVKESYIPSNNTIASKLPVPLQVTPASVGVVTEPLVLEQNGVVLSDALKNISGLNVQPGVGVSDFFLIRGFDSISSSVVMTDGAQEPEVTYYPVYNIEGVEVLKGPAGYLYGSNPLAGAVNIVRKQPVPNNFVDFRARYGSFDSGEAALDWNWSSEDGTYNFRLNSAYMSSDLYRDDKKYRQFGVNPSFAWRPDAESSLVVNLEYLDTEASPDAGIPLYNNAVPDVRRQNSYQSPFDFSEQTLGRFQVDYQRQMSDLWTLRNKTYYRDLDWQTNGSLMNGVFPSPIDGEPVVDRTLTLLDDQQRFIGNQLEAVMTLTSGKVEHTLLTGLELIHQTDTYTFDLAELQDEFGFRSLISLENPVETATQFQILPPIPGNDQLPDGDATTRTVAPYVVDQMKLSPRFQLLVGARYDVIDFKDDVNPDLDRDEGKLSPRLGLNFAQTPSLSWYVNAGESFSPPSPRVSGERVPEESRQIELGARKQFLNDKLRTTFAVYRLDRENIPIPDANGVTQQAGDQRSTGFEIELAAEPRKRLRTFFVYAYNKSELTRFTESVFDPFLPGFVTFDRSGNTAPFAPENLANLWVSYTFKGGFGIAGGARYVGEQYIAPDNAFQIDAATIFDATLSYNFRSVKVFLNMQNLTDTDYEVRGFGNTSVTPGNPFAAYVGFSLNL